MRLQSSFAGQLVKDLFDQAYRVINTVLGTYPHAKGGRLGASTVVMCQFFQRSPQPFAIQLRARDERYPNAKLMQMLTPIELVSDMGNNQRWYTGS